MKALIAAAIIMAAPVTSASKITNMVITLDSIIVNTQGKNLPGCFINKAVAVPATCSVVAAALREHVCGPRGFSQTCRRSPLTVIDFIIDGKHTGAS